MLLFVIWPVGGDIPFVWQTAFAQVAAALRAEADPAPLALAGWSAETLDGPSMTLLLAGRPAPLSHFQPEAGTLLLPGGARPRLARPAVLPLHPYWEGQLAAWGAPPQQRDAVVWYELPQPPPLRPVRPLAVSFGGELELLGLDAPPCAAGERCALVTIWRVTAVPAAARQLFVQYLDAAGNLVGEHYSFDRPDPQGHWFAHWQAGDLLLQRHELPAEGPAVARLRIGWFDPYTCAAGGCRNLPTAAGEPFLELDWP